MLFLASEMRYNEKQSVNIYCVHGFISHIKIQKKRDRVLTMAGGAIPKLTWS